MTTISKVFALVLSLVVIAVVSSFVFYMESPRATFGASPAGSTFNDSKVADVSINLAAPGSNATSSSILNGDVNDRYITSEKTLCENVGTSQTAYTGTGLASLTVTIATSSTAAPATNGNTNTLPVITISTSSAQFTIGSSTAQGPGNNLVANIWKAGSYLTFTANATNTATCIVGVNYSGS